MLQDASCGALQPPRDLPVVVAVLAARRAQELDPFFFGGVLFLFWMNRDGGLSPNEGQGHNFPSDGMTLRREDHPKPLTRSRSKWHRQPPPFFKFYDNYYAYGGLILLTGTSPGLLQGYHDSSCPGHGRDRVIVSFVSDRATLSPIRDALRKRRQRPQPSNHPPAR